MNTTILFFLLFFSINISYAQNSERTGKASMEEIEKDKKHSWFKKGYKRYKPEQNAVKILKNNSSSLSFIVFAGLWCPDTQNHLPQFYKVTDQIGIGQDKILLYLLDRNHHSSDLLEKQYDIKLVPTIILLKNNIEIGKIVEKPDKSIEEDLVKFLSGK